MQADLEEKLLCSNPVCDCPVLHTGEACSEECRVADPRNEVCCDCHHERCQVDDHLENRH